MIFLLSVLTNTGIYWLFKYYERINARIFETIVFNYITAFICGIIVVPDFKQATSHALELHTWSVAGMSMGALFIAVFYFMAITAKKAGVSIATLSSKMSLVLAVVLFAILGKDPITWLEGLALVLAMFGLYLFSVEGNAKFAWSMLLYPLVLMLGSTGVDFSIAYFQSFTDNDNDRALFSCLPFLGAGTIGITLLLFRMMKGNYVFPFKEMLTGLVLGLVNYGSIYFLVELYATKWMPESSILPINNLGVLVLSAVGAVFLFKEHLNKRKIQGLVLCVFALALLSW